MKLFDGFEAVKFTQENLIFITHNGYIYYIYNSRSNFWRKHSNAGNDPITVANYPSVYREELVDAMNKLRGVYQLAMQLQYDNKRTQSNMTVGMVEDVEEKSPIELISEFYEKQNGQAMNDDQTELVTNLIHEIFA